MIDLLDIMADEVIEHPMFDVIPKMIEKQESFERVVREDPNQAIFFSMAGNADYLDPDQHSRWHRGFVNLLRWLGVSYVEEPYLNSRIGWMFWYIAVYSKHDSYLPMRFFPHQDIPAWVIPIGLKPELVFGRHYEPRKWYRKGQPHIPPEMGDPDDPFDLHPEKMKVIRAEEEAKRKARMEKYIDAGASGSERFGFSSDTWRGFFTIRGNDVYLCSIRSLSPKQGNFNALLSRIKEEGFNVKVVNPVKSLEVILIKKGFIPIIEIIGGDDAIIWKEA